MKMTEKERLKDDLNDIVGSAISQAENWGLKDNDLIYDKIFSVSNLRILRSALEPKVVTREWVEKVADMAEDCVDGCMHECGLERESFIEGFMLSLKEAGIKVG